MTSESSVLSKNIKFLRKENKLSQEELASRLGIKRSNIAAYESKNVEPRLRIVLELARLFNVSVKALIDENISEGNVAPGFDEQSSSSKGVAKTLEIDGSHDVSEFIDKSMRIRKVLEGFKSFYAFKKNNVTESTPSKDKLMFDIENFMQLMDHLLDYNETVITAISKEQASSSN